MIAYFFLWQMNFIEVIVNIKRTLKRVWWQWLILDFGEVISANILVMTLIYPGLYQRKSVFSKHVCAQSLRRRPRGQPPKRQRWTLKKVNNLYTSSIKGNFILWSIQTISSPRATVGTTLSWNIAEQVSLQSRIVLGKRWIKKFPSLFLHFSM